MAEPIRVSPEEARQKVASSGALLICAYDDDEKFKMVHLEGAISLNEFKERIPTLDRNRELIFYCA